MVEGWVVSEFGSGLEVALMIFLTSGNVSSQLWLGIRVDSSRYRVGEVILSRHDVFRGA